MNTTVMALQSLYVKLGGELTDAYDGIADGIPVGDYVLIPDVIEACTQLVNEGGGGGGFVILATDGTLDKTWREIYDALEGGKICAVYDINSAAEQISVSYVTTVFNISDDYTVVCTTVTTGTPGATEYVATGADGYPAESGAPI